MIASLPPHRMRWEEHDYTTIQTKLCHSFTFICHFDYFFIRFSPPKMKIDCGPRCSVFSDLFSVLSQLLFLVRTQNTQTPFYSHFARPQNNPKKRFVLWHMLVRTVCEIHLNRKIIHRHRFKWIQCEKRYEIRFITTDTKHTETVFRRQNHQRKHHYATRKWSTQRKTTVRSVLHTMEKPLN